MFKKLPFKTILSRSAFIGASLAITASSAFSDDGILVENSGRPKFSPSAYLVGGDFGLGSGLSFTISDRPAADASLFKVDMGGSDRSDGKSFLNFSLLVRREKPVENSNLIISSDVARIKVNPFKSEINFVYGLATIGLIDRSADGKTAAMINARPITIAVFRDSMGNSADTNAESAVDLAFRHSLSSVLSINAESSFALGWGSDARSSEVKGSISCKLGEKSPWCIDLSAISQTVAFKDNSNVLRRNAAQSVRLGVSYSPAN